MDAKRKIKGGLLGFIGFLLSPLSWWNDLFVNIPLALALAWVISLFDKAAFTATFVIGYWLTNVLGLVLMHKGAKTMLSDKPQPYTRKEFVRDMGISIAYTLLIVLLIEFKVIEPLPNYFPSHF